ncbi:DEAD/DEAH box helicase [Alicyclobacillus acidoterrestris]|uniref:DEAD/DEAH box helicase n=1 Tax=Alicyclobacillus acidoterrestris (strain ATCC 49025 / DSM 3922 / CIP 106132 / NCIMB 13137 / GD3B) TaxID=1356854 RepID=T0CUE5_ALIAG|nr:DEAD/DEAH box helicase [Alicyclobacillus acidoterrestris]EPZ42997.1 ATP-dependent helicase [Alicyclobacillus acidoterrestris ATCC 49025]UNO49791.1 DEAD/DEAH box helicase [Alicyclobacillus acidoterrestris]
MNLEQLLNEWQRDPSFMSQVAAWRVSEATAGRFRPIPATAHTEVLEALQSRGIRQLFSHQEEAWNAIQAGKDTMVVTPTASGKTLCYNLPVLNAICEDPSVRALYIFPTKALAQDQVAELSELIEHVKTQIHSFTYDGDTPVHARQRIREAGHIVVTNPDMLHAAILPHHTKWLRLFENLKYIVIDETHMYRGVFGSHFANVLRRLDRICAFYGAKPQYIMSSATIQNPGELGHLLTGRDVYVVDKSGAPQGERHTVLYNPPIVHPKLGLRQSSLQVARKMAGRLLNEGISTIAFVKTRTQVEVLSSYLKADAKERLRAEIVGYRGGYLPSERRSIERGLRSGELKGVVSTNALELGVDIGSLDASLTVGYPGSVASVLQQSGRAGRRRGVSLAMFIANASALDQYLVHHPEALLETSPESARIYPDNLLILMDHLKCAAYELPFAADESFSVETTSELLEYLADARILHVGRDRKYHWMADALPSAGVSLRSAAQENVVIVDETDGRPRVIGETDRFSALTTLHEEAIYLHQSKSYQVEKLDLENGKAFVRAVEADYYTDAELAVRLQVLDQLASTQEGPASHTFGELAVNATPTLFKKIKFDTHENLGWGRIYLPEAELHTVGYWVSWEPAAFELTQEDWESALKGLGYLLKHASALHCMCATSDLHVTVQVRDPLGQRPTLYVYDAYPGGIGLSERVFRDRDLILSSSFDMIRQCSCEFGCPSCVGPGHVDEHLKERARMLLIASMTDTAHQERA